MKLWKVEFTHSWDRSSSVIRNYYFETEEEAKEFVEKGNEILHRNEAYYCHSLSMDKWNNPIDITVGEVNKELNKLADEFKDYKY